MGRRKPTVTTKVVKPASSEDENLDDVIEEDVIEEVKPKSSKSPTRKVNGRSLPEDLPEGTVVVEPESASDESSSELSEDKKGKNKNPSNGLPKGELLTELPQCTACAKRIHPEKRRHLCLHPVLKVLICKKCYNYYTSGEFDKDEDGFDEQCRWCGEGGQLLCCDYCTSAFCKPCVKRNIGRSALYNLVNAPDETKWKCYVCRPSPLRKLQEDCERIRDAVKRKHEQQKEAQHSKTTEIYHLSDLRETAEKFIKIQDAISGDLKNLVTKIDSCEKQAKQLSGKQFSVNKAKLAAKLDSLTKLMRNGSMMLKLRKSTKPDPLGSAEPPSTSKRDLKVRSSLDLNPDMKEDCTTIESEDDVPQAMEITVDVHTVPGTGPRAGKSDEGVECNVNSVSRVGSATSESRGGVTMNGVASSDDGESRKKKKKKSPREDEIVELSDQKSIDVESCDDFVPSQKKRNKNRLKNGDDTNSVTVGSDHDDTNTDCNVDMANSSGTDQPTPAGETSQIALNDEVDTPKKTEDSDSVSDLDGQKSAKTDKSKSARKSLFDDRESDGEKPGVRKKRKAKAERMNIGSDSESEIATHRFKKTSKNEAKKSKLKRLTSSASEENSDVDSKKENAKKKKKKSAVEKVEVPPVDSDQESPVEDDQTNPEVKSEIKVGDLKLKPLSVRLVRCDSGNESGSINLASERGTPTRRSSRSASREEDAKVVPKQKLRKAGPKSSKTEDIPEKQSDSAEDDNRSEDKSKTSDQSVEKPKKAGPKSSKTKNIPEEQSELDSEEDDKKSENESQKRGRSVEKSKKAGPKSSKRKSKSESDSEKDDKKTKDKSQKRGRSVEKSKKSGPKSSKRKSKSESDSEKDDKKTEDKSQKSGRSVEKSKKAGPKSSERRSNENQSDSDSEKDDKKTEDRSKRRGRNVEKSKKAGPKSSKTNNVENQSKSDSEADDKKTEEKSQKRGRGVDKLKKAEPKSSKNKSTKIQSESDEDDKKSEDKSQRRGRNSETSQMADRKVTEGETDAERALNELEELLNEGEESGSNTEDCTAADVLNDDQEEPTNEKAKEELEKMMLDCEDENEIDAADVLDDDKEEPTNEKAKEELEKMMLDSEDENEIDALEDDEVAVDMDKENKSALKALEEMMVEEGLDDCENGTESMDHDGVTENDDNDNDDKVKPKKENVDNEEKNVKENESPVKGKKTSSNLSKSPKLKKPKSPKKELKKSPGKTGSSSSSDSTDSDEEEDRPRKKKLKKRAKKVKSEECAKVKKPKVVESSDSSDFEKLLTPRKSRAGSKPGPRCSKKKDESKNSSEDKKETKTKSKKKADDSESDLDTEIKKLTSFRHPSKKKKDDSSGDQDSDSDDKSVKKEKTEGKKEGSGKVNGRGQEESDSDDAVQNISDDSESEEESKTSKLLKELGGTVEKAKKSKKVSASEDDDSDIEEIDSDSDSDRKKKTKKGKAKGKGKGTESESSMTTRKKKKQFGADLLRGKLSESDSGSGAKRKTRKSKKKNSDESDYVISDSDVPTKRSKRKRGRKSSDSESSPGKKRRRRIKTLSDSSLASDEEDRPKMKRKKKSDKGDSEEEEEGDDAPGSAHKRKHIRKIISDKKLEADTKAATQEEEERRKRVEARQKLYNEIHCESETVGEDKVPITTKLALEVDEETKETLIEVDKELIRNLKPHQVEAVKFMWNCTIESLEQMKKSEGSGCVLAHCMGLGKTLSVITLVHTVLRHKKLLGLKTCIVICPLNTVLNWENEWAKWFEDNPDVRVNIFEMSQYKTHHQRLACLKDWQHDGGVCIIGYEMFRNLGKGNHMRSKKMKASFAECLLNPGPDLVVCDEGHILKNCDSGLSKITQEIKTLRRIILTGTPLQNNLGEYHCMVSFVKPKLLGTKKEFYNRFIAPIINGSCADSTQRDVRIMKKRAHVLHEMLNGCVQRRDYSALTPYLPPKFEYVVSIRLSQRQIDIYQKYMDRKEEASEQGTTGSRLFQDFQALMRIWTHPWVMRMHHVRVLEQRAKQEMDESDDEFLDDNDDSESESSKSSSSSSSDDEKEEAKNGSGNEKAGPSKRERRRNARRGRRGSGSDEEIVSKWKTTTRSGVLGADQDGLEKEEETEDIGEWWSEFSKDEDEKNLKLSGKLVILFEILKKAEEIGDKVLVFSQSLLSLDIIEKFLDVVDMAPETISPLNAENGEDESNTKPMGCTWVKGADYFRLDGSTSAFNRQKYCDVFNDYENPRARLFLISTRAGSLGINLVHANRVVVFDASWNPTYDVQSMFRVYRFGQLKPVYVYRMVAQGTMEEKIYERQVTKQSLSQRVVDEHQIDRHFNTQDLQELYRFDPDRLDDPNRKERPTPALPKDLFLADLLKEQSEWIVGYHEHDSLLENKVDQELSEEERKAAWEEYEAEKKGLITNAAPYMGMASGVSASEWLSHYAQRGSNLPNYPNPLMPQMLMPPDSFLQEVSRQLLRQNPDMPPAEVMQRARGYWIRNLQVQELQKQQLLAAQQQELIRLHQMRQQQRLMEHQRLQQAQKDSSRSKPNILQNRASAPEGATMRALLTDGGKKPETHVIPDD